MKPVSRTNLNTAGEIRINIELQDVFTHPAKSYLQIDGRLTKADGSAYANADVVALTNNGLMHLFPQMTHSLSKSRSRGDLSPRAGYNNAWNAEVSRRFC